MCVWERKGEGLFQSAVVCVRMGVSMCVFTCVCKRVCKHTQLSEPSTVRSRLLGSRLLLSWSSSSVVSGSAFDSVCLPPNLYRPYPPLLPVETLQSNEHGFTGMRSESELAI